MKVFLTVSMKLFQLRFRPLPPKDTDSLSLPRIHLYSTNSVSRTSRTSRATSRTSWTSRSTSKTSYEMFSMGLRTPSKHLKVGEAVFWP